MFILKSYINLQFGEMKRIDMREICHESQQSTRPLNNLDRVKINMHIYIHIVNLNTYVCTSCTCDVYTRNKIVRRSAYCAPTYTNYHKKLQSM